MVPVIYTFFTYHITSMISIKKKKKCYSYIQTQNDITVLDGALKTSPIPPPFLRPWFNVVTMHITNESHARSFISPPMLTKSWLFPCSLTTMTQVQNDYWNDRSAFIKKNYIERINEWPTFAYISWHCFSWFTLFTITNFTSIGSFIVKRRYKIQINSQI